jgi:hypothetical protein
MIIDAIHVILRWVETITLLFIMIKYFALMNVAKQN